MVPAMVGHLPDLLAPIGPTAPARPHLAGVPIQRIVAVAAVHIHGHVAPGARSAALPPGAADVDRLAPCDLAAAPPERQTDAVRTPSRGQAPRLGWGLEDWRREGGRLSPFCPPPVRLKCPVVPDTSLQGCIRRGGRGGLKGGGGWLGSPSLLGSPYGPRQRRAENF